MKKIENPEFKPKSPVVAVVDDEELVTRSIKSFLEMETDYQVLTYLSPREAIEDLSLNQPDLVIADFLMPDMNGLEFLAEIRNRYPDVPRVLLTGYADKENAIKGINDVGLFQYIQKPWDNDNLKLVIKNGLDNKNLEQTLKVKIREIDTILRQRDELFQVNNLLQEEMTFAKRIHSNLIGPERVEHNGIAVHNLYQPAFDIGGDFYDVIPLSDNRLAVILVDLTGHGIQAALCTALVKFAVSGLKNSTASAVDIMRGINKVMYRGLPKEIFAASLLAVIYTETGNCELLNGGIPYPLLLKRDEKEIEKLNINGMLLGMLEDALYKPGEISEVTLEKGDCLFMFTDGLSEAQNSKGEFLEVHHLCDTITANLDADPVILSNNLADMARQFNENGQMVDDMTIVSIERK